MNGVDLTEFESRRTEDRNNFEDMTRGIILSSVNTCTLLPSLSDQLQVRFPDNNNGNDVPGMAFAHWVKSTPSGSRSKGTLFKPHLISNTLEIR